MGLDNGICVKNTEYSRAIHSKVNMFSDSIYTERGADYEFAYWRKCWNVREEIIHILGGWEGDMYAYSLSIENVEKIIKVLSNYNFKNWEYGGFLGSIWTWREHKKVNGRHIRQLKYLVRLMKRYPELEVYFYDSY